MRSLIILLFATVLTTVCKAQKPYDFYYLAIGSAHYEQNEDNFTDKKFIPYDNLPAAKLSVELMQGVFERYIHAKGLTLISTERSMVTKKRIFASLDALDLQIRKDRAKKPFIIFYYCGHGTAENMAWTQMLIPGDFTESLQTRLNKEENKREFTDKITMVNEITDRFAEKKYEYLIFMDCCRGSIRKGDNSKPLFDYASSQYDKMVNEKLKGLNIDQKYLIEGKRNAMGNLRAGMKDFGRMNEFHQADAVVFASTPGKEADLVPLPQTSILQGLSVSNGPKVGPLCRRSILAFSKFLKSSSPQYTVYNFIDQLKNKQLDQQSPIPITGYEDKPGHANQLVLIRR